MLVYWPAGHDWQARSAVADGVLLTKVPDGHSTHDAHVAALVEVLNCPLGHAAQTRSATAEPSEETKLPGAHADFATQAVAALASLSQVQAGQGVGGLAPPAQKLPGAQAAHTAGEVGVPLAICS